VFGCFAETLTPFLAGTKVALRISHGGSVFPLKEGSRMLANVREWASPSR
jgi:hypothetical protein